MTSSTLADDRESRVSKRPWILEKSLPLVLVTESISCWLATTIQTLQVAGGAQVFGDGLQVEHQFGIITDILADFIHQKNNVMVAGFAIRYALTSRAKPSMLKG